MKREKDMAKIAKFVCAIIVVLSLLLSNRASGKFIPPFKYFVFIYSVVSTQFFILFY